MKWLQLTEVTGAGAFDGLDMVGLHRRKGQQGHLVATFAEKL
jgi:hypothetical protein